MFWPYRNEYSKNENFDDELMNFIRLVIAYQYWINHKDLDDEQKRSELLVSQGALNGLSITEYEELGCLTKSFVIQLIDLLDLLSDDESNTTQIKHFLQDDFYYKEEQSFINVLRNRASYDDRLKFFAFYYYLLKWPESSYLMDWLRVVYNLVENTIINTAEDFFKAFDSIDTMLQATPNVLDTLTGDSKILGFTGAQIIEERIKAHLLKRSLEWREAIISSERHPYLKGQVGCILKFSGILDYFRDHSCCDWSEKDNDRFYTQFKHYSQAIQAVFDQIKDSSSSIDFLWERSVLCKGEYFTEKQYRKYNMLTSRDTRNNITRDHSWKRLLRIDNKDYELKQEFVKAVIDDPLFNVSALKDSLSAICRAALLNQNLELWKRIFIKHPELMAYCKQGFIEKDGSDFYLLGQSQRNHKHSELYTRAIWLELKNDKDKLLPFPYMLYEEVRSTEENPSLKIYGYAFERRNYSLSIYKSFSGIRIRFDGGLTEDCPTELKEALIKSGFKFYDGLLTRVEIPVDNPTSTLDDVKQHIWNICSTLRDLGL